MSIQIDQSDHAKMCNNQLPSKHRFLIEPENFVTVYEHQATGAVLKACVYDTGDAMLLTQSVLTSAALHLPPFVVRLRFGDQVEPVDFGNSKRLPGIGWMQSTEYRWSALISFDDQPPTILAYGQDDLTTVLKVAHLSIKSAQ